MPASGGALMNFRSGGLNRGKARGVAIFLLMGQTLTTSGASAGRTQVFVTGSWDY
jgi:hypothetical protein